MNRRQLFKTGTEMSETTSRESAETTLLQATTDFVAEGGRVLLSDGQTKLDDRGRLMSALRIHYDGRRYLYKTYCYDKLADAVAYAQLTESRDQEPESAVPARRSEVFEPSAEDRLVMAELRISFEAGVYEFDGFHYDRLADAAKYAMHLRKVRDAGSEGARTRTSER